MVTVGVCQYDLRHHDLPDDQKLVPVGGGAGREFPALHLPGLCDAFGGGEEIALDADEVGGRRTLDPKLVQVKRRTEVLLRR